MALSAVLLTTLLLGALAAAPSAVDIYNSDDFYRGICSEAEVLNIRSSFQLSSLSPLEVVEVPCIIARNVTCIGSLDDGGHPWIDFAFVRNKISLQPHIRLTFEHLALTNYKYGGGGDLDFIAPSPQAIWQTVDVNKNAPFCSMPSNASVAALRRNPLPVGHPELANWTQTVNLEAVWCQEGRCWHNTLTYDQYAQPMIKSDDVGTFVIAKIQSVKSCNAFISAECAQALGAEGCIQKSIDEMLAAQAAAGNVQRSQGLSTGAKIGIAVGAAVGGALVLSAAAFAIALRFKGRHSSAASAASSDSCASARTTSKIVPPKDLESGSSRGHGSSETNLSSHSRTANLQIVSTMEVMMGFGTKDSFGFNSAHNFAGILGSQQALQIPSSQNSTRCLVAAGICEDGTAVKLALAEPLGAGSFGVVMRGTLSCGTTVAVKIIAHDKQHANEVLTEVKLMMNFAHPNVLAAMHYLVNTRIDNRVSLSSDSSVSKLEDMLISTRTAAAARISASKQHQANRRNSSGSSTGRTEVSELWIITAYCEGGSLQQAARRGDFLTHARALSLGRALAVLRDIAAGMEYLHARQVCHGDLKAQNVLLAANGTTAAAAAGTSSVPTPDQAAAGCDPAAAWPWVGKVADFGLSRALKDDETHRSTRTTGTVTHMPPELLRSGKLMPAGDVYAFGIIMWEVATGRMPYQGLMYGEVVERVVVSHRRPVFPVYVPPAYAALASRCWAADPAARPTFASVLAALNDLAGCEAELQAHADQYPGLDLATPLPDGDYAVCSK